MEEEYESEGEEETKLDPEQEAEISLAEHEYEEFDTESDVEVPGDEKSDFIREEIVDSTGLKRLSYSERVQVQKRQRNLKELEIHFQQKDRKVQKISAALFRLRAQHRRLCEELRVEEDLQSKIDLTLQANECELFKVELEYAKLTRLREEHKQDEEGYEAQRLLEAKRRLEAEEAAILQARTRKPMKDVEKQKLEHRKAVEDAKKYNQKSIQYLKESLARTRQEEADKELKMREDLEKRMQVILALKNNIAMSRGSLRVIQANKSAQAAAEKQKKLSASVHPESGSFLQHKFQQKRLKEFEKKKQAFTEEQKTLKAEIMAKLLREESNMEKKKRVYPVLFPETPKSHDDSSEVWNLRKKLLHYIDTPEDEKDINTSDQEWRSPSQTSNDEPVAEQIQDTSTQDVSDHEEEEESLNLPEFSGLWNKEHKLSKDETIIKHLGAGTSKMEQEILVRQLEKQRSGIVQKQVAAGREFKGCPFYSKPDIIHFQVNEDFEGEIIFRTHIGSFAIPLKCTTKKCDLVVDQQVVDFGCHTIGEIITRNITLTNRGARSTYFQFVKFHPKQSIVGEELNEFIIPAEKDLFDLEQIIQTDVKVGEVLDCTGSEMLLQVRDCTGTEMLLQVLDCTGSEMLLQVLDCTGSEMLLQVLDCTGTEMLLQIRIETRAEAVDVPVWLSNPNKDLKICMYDRLYQDSICAHSRASTALQLKFEVCEELRNHLELLPKTGYIQAHSHFSFQLKFVPRKSLPEDAKQYFNANTRVLEAPMSILVANQTKTIPFTVHAIVTSSDFDISPQMIDFGYCTIYEAVWTTIKLTNKSILSQEYGFVDTPEYIDVQPNDGFGVLLPLETVNIDIIFKAKQAEEYAFKLICKSEINRKFKISCKAVGVFPPLKLSHSVIHFAATALNDTSTVTIYVENSNTSQNPHPAQRIGKGAIVPVGPASFEFVVPEYSYLTIAPAGGTVMPGEKCIVHLTFKPTLPDLLVQEEAVRILWRAAETERIWEKRDSDSTSKSLDFSNKKKPQLKHKDVNQLNLSSSKLPVKETSSKSDSSLFELPNPTDVPLDSDDYNTALAALLRNFKEEFHSFVIPCFITHRTTDHKESGYLPYSINNTLYLEVNCPTAAQPIILISGNKQNVVDFGAIAVEQRVLKKIEIQNISPSTLDLKSSVMDPGGPFELLNSLRSLQPGATHNLIFSFSPAKSKLFYEPLEIRSVKGNLSLILTGCGIDPLVICSVESVLDVGYVLANQSRTVTFQLQNATILNVMFSVKLDSLSYSKHREQQVLPAFVTPHKISGSLVGTQNYRDQSVFSVSPIEGSIGPMQSQEFEVTFSPDHESLYYSDCMQVELFDKVAHTIQLKGAAREHLMFVEGGDPITVPVESLSILPSYDVADVPRILKSVLLILKSTKSDDKLTTALEEFHVGCIQSTLANAKKSVEFTIDSPQALQMKGFTFDPVKAMVEAGTTKAVTVSWTPPSGHDPFQIISATVKMSIKGDITENYQIILTAMVVST
ncbi:hypothetical protein scyTo_0009999 [Scyliorhinus torazame]|uniref:Abnormal spindle-like microcephaly-associated protein ASH domain-containing protein n=1 Tax=Scyliorhinus torazame TaxID=75743 RepID=A0A401NXZ1_SCYTO|nr:hypothetical protein [Scyliorhinus torazame]